MLNAASTDYGHEGTFGDTRASALGRIPPLNTTDLLIQTAIAPAARKRYTEPPNSTTSTGFRTPDDQAMFLGPMGSTDLYSVALSAAYIVNDTYTGFQYATYDFGDSSNLAVYESTTPAQFSYEDWSSFFLWGGEGTQGSVLFPATDVNRNLNMTVMKMPFQGGFGGPPGECGQGFGPPFGDGQGQGPPDGQGRFYGANQGPPDGQGQPYGEEQMQESGNGQGDTRHDYGRDRGLQSMLARRR
jgi:hypothetical protein